LYNQLDALLLRLVINGRNLQEIESYPHLIVVGMKQEKSNRFVSWSRWTFGLLPCNSKLTLFLMSNSEGPKSSNTTILLPHLSRVRSTWIQPLLRVCSSAWSRSSIRMGLVKATCPNSCSAVVT
jgi:hypothetical protein